MNILEAIKNYHRPINTLLFGLTMIVVLIGCISGKFPCVETTPVMTILSIMGGYMGVYAISRSSEKILKKTSEQ